MCSFFVALQYPVLVKHPESKDLLANFDPMVYQVIRETEVMKKLGGFDVSDSAQRLLYMQKKLKDNHSQLLVRLTLVSVEKWCKCSQKRLKSVIQLVSGSVLFIFKP